MKHNSAATSTTQPPQAHLLLLCEQEPVSQQQRQKMEPSGSNKRSLSGGRADESTDDTPSCKRERQSGGGDDSNSDANSNAAKDGDESVTSDHQGCHQKSSDDMEQDGDVEGVDSTALGIIAREAGLQEQSREGDDQETSFTSNDSTVAGKGEHQHYHHQEGEEAGIDDLSEMAEFHQPRIGDIDGCVADLQHLDKLRETHAQCLTGETGAVEQLIQELKTIRRDLDHVEMTLCSQAAKDADWVDQEFIIARDSTNTNIKSIQVLQRATRVFQNMAQPF